jgi:hypothetical protein
MDCCDCSCYPGHTPYINSPLRADLVAVAINACGLHVRKGLSLTAFFTGPTVVDISGSADLTAVLGVSIAVCIPAHHTHAQKPSTYVLDISSDTSLYLHPSGEHSSQCVALYYNIIISGRCEAYGNHGLLTNSVRGEAET